MALPMLAVFTLTMAWLVSVGITEVRALDAAREAARAAARSENAGQARSLASAVAPAGSTVSITRGSGTVVVRVSSPVGGPAGLLGSVSGFRVHARAVAAQEPTA
jgi:hypothetical protein